MSGVAIGVALEALAWSAREFVTRFGLVGTQPVEKVARNLLEETGEVVVELAKDDLAKAVNEFADVLYVGLTGFYALGVTEEQIAEALQEVARKNNGKTLETHTFFEGKVRRK